MRNDRAAILSEIERYDEAAAEYNELISECSALYGSKGHDTLIAMGNLAGVLHDVGKIPQAIQLRSRAINGLRILHGETDTDYLRELVNLSHDYEDIGNYYKAISILKTACELRERALGKNNDMTINALFQLAVYYKKIYRDHEAVHYFRKAVGCIEYEDFYTLIHKAQFAICCARTGEKKRAEALAEIVRQQLGCADFGAEEVLENLEYAHSWNALYAKNLGAALRHAEKAVDYAGNDENRKIYAEEFLAEISFHTVDLTGAYSLYSLLSDYFENSEISVSDTLKYYCAYSWTLSALGMFREAESAVSAAERCGRQCDFAAADFLIYSARAFLALRQNKSDEFVRLRSIALAYAENGIDLREFEVRWLKNLK